MGKPPDIRICRYCRRKIIRDELGMNLAFWRWRIVEDATFEAFHCGRGYHKPEKRAKGNKHKK